MKKTITILAILLVTWSNLSAQYQVAYKQAKAQEKKGLYYKAILSYNAAAISRDKPAANDVNKRISYCANKLNNLRLEAKKQKKIAETANKKALEALAKAEQMQLKMETSIFDKAVKAEDKNWKGFANYETEYNRNKALKSIESLDLSSNALTSLPKELYNCTNLKKLNLLENSDIPWKETLKSLSRLTKLNEIYVSVLDLDNIPKEYWAKITGIELLKTNLTKIPANILVQKQLNYLDLSGEYQNENSISVISLALFELKNLEYLNIDRCNIGTLPKEIGKLTNLSKLSLSWNKLSILPTEIENLTNLQNLSANYNSLPILSASILKLTKLKELNLAYNTLAIIPSEIKNLKQLEYLNLSFNNNISTFPIDICSLINLKELNLEINKITSLPEEIGNLKELTLLGIGGNQLTNIPKGIGNLKKITFLSLWSNKLISLPDEICELVNVREFFLTGNQLIELPAKIGNFTRLTNLDLTNNKLTTLPQSIEKLTNLETLFAIMNNFSEEEKEKIKKRLPNCKLIL